MKDKIYIFGHQNPDTDSICSAIAYANLKKALGYKKATAYRLGAISNETQYALDYFNVQIPRQIEKLELKVKDLYLRNVICVKPQDSIVEAVDVIVNKNKYSTPVVDEQERIIGVVTLIDLYNSLIGKVSNDHLKNSKTPFKNIVKALEGNVIHGTYPYEFVEGEVSTLSEVISGKTLLKGDILIAKNLKDNNEIVFNSGASCIIISKENEDKSVDEIPEDYEGIVIEVNTSIFNIIKIIEKTVPIEKMINKRTFEYFELNDSLEEIKEQILASQHRSFPVVDEDGKVVGLLARSDLLKVNRKKVILVDHNEKDQSIEGIEDAEILEIIDHHKIGNVQTMAPLFFRAEPVGCTATIIYDLYKEEKIPIPKEMAGIMLSAILSDTLLFNSPTCTHKDKETAKELARIAGVNMNAYGMDMIIAGTAIEHDETPEALITRDMKRFAFGKHKIMVSQINTGDFKALSNMLPVLKQKIEEICQNEELDLAVLMVTSIIIGGTEIIIAGKNKVIAQKAFELNLDEDTIFLSGVFSRKKQVIPKLMNAAQT
ncbi:manganese-dependent inorganic pyrophosphatase [Natranaerovirga hydrolytica]|uniref:inorganic diphosphatase n=1 Tax=Natranaerovirga hydrolytica TaxID=680378 RepID=A0A4R1MK20_9FIRM|nr:putative manganese-dependent inorganic diphosphatase [Natranaerovirga hydrolytica]TCK92360.1 manganese-dependent inorganic pyrophosphatase [Natranaerovirga hydrolytica]